ncbi:hypothetical protein AMTRI_Chr06g200020 [Amborella trichopoda]|uniref:TAZ-type domain-containing protein n=1 Tax=Amborella trichopoda TaxID=13333 RepID=W1Q0U5_AMBTC|nr:BTB/POZ and TAZ domain-containing protein 1 [Amborella trichopoda]ERN13690.1 hypothetical protein AMTR_s00049p00138770 [Amborella trichopoda]|eukprot:XP_006852223.1 BTB/POZ and TAZ domain-containing protein 1 [Amborella trichopoda]
MEKPLRPHDISTFDADSCKRIAQGPVADVQIVTSDGHSIASHSRILAFASPVLENLVGRPQRNEGLKTISIPGVPHGAVHAFIGFLSTLRCMEGEMEKYGVHLLVLSHAFSVPQLKRICTRALAELLTVDNVVDVLQLARQCDAPSLYLRCMKLISKDFKKVEGSEGWKFMQDNDPWLELEILQVLSEEEHREKRRQRHKEEQKIYLQLSEAMESLLHICTEGCSTIGPYDRELNVKKGPCKYQTCEGLERLIRHFAGCKKKVGGGCPHCRRLWQLLELHSRICEQSATCKVPLCMHFKLKIQFQSKKDEERWKLLVRKVVSAKAISSLSKRKREEELHNFGERPCPRDA